MLQLNSKSECLTSLSVIPHLLFISSNTIWSTHCLCCTMKLKFILAYCGVSLNIALYLKIFQLGKISSKCLPEYSKSISFCVFILFSAGTSVWFWRRRCVHVIPWATFPHVQLCGVWRAAVHDATKLHRVGHHERTEEYVSSANIVYTCPQIIWHRTEFKECPKNCNLK